MSGWNATAWLLGLGGLVALLVNGHSLLKLVKVAVWDALMSHMRKLSHKDREAINAKIADLQDQVMHLTERVSELRIRDELNFDFVIYDQSWHRTFELKAAELGWQITPHVNYSEFREKWLLDHAGYQPFI